MARVPVNGLHFNVEAEGEGAPLLLLHGFTGSAAGWAPQIEAFAGRARIVAVDLLGHGRSDAPADPRRYRIERAGEDIVGVLDRLGLRRTTVLGYSMGGRLGMWLATAAPDRVGALILDSASPGLRDPAQRRAREVDDARLATTIERDGIAAFVAHWERLSMFATQAGLPEAVRRSVRAQRLQHTAIGLANSLRGMGQGVQPPLHDRLPQLRIPTLLIAGAFDPAYCAHAREMSTLIPGARLAIVPDAGHAVHLEQPDAFCRLVLDFLDEVTAGHAVR